MAPSFELGLGDIEKCRQHLSPTPWGAGRAGGQLRSEDRSWRRDGAREMIKGRGGAKQSLLKVE